MELHTRVADDDGAGGLELIERRRHDGEVSSNAMQERKQDGDSEDEERKRRGERGNYLKGRERKMEGGGIAGWDGGANDGSTSGSGVACLHLSSLTYSTLLDTFLL